MIQNKINTSLGLVPMALEYKTKKKIYITFDKKRFAAGDGNFFCIFFWRTRVCRPLLRLCRPFMIFEGCLDSNQSAAVASWRATDLATHPS
jgi:hypothetical protein